MATTSEPPALWLEGPRNNQNLSYAANAREPRLCPRHAGSHLLPGLLDDVLCAILLSLEHKSLLRVSETCTALRDAASDEQLWKARAHAAAAPPRPSFDPAHDALPANRLRILYLRAGRRR